MSEPRYIKLLEKIRDEDPYSRERALQGLRALAEKWNGKTSCQKSKTVGSRARTPLINAIAKDGNDGT